jgi:hypothetical protein
MLARYVTGFVEQTRDSKTERDRFRLLLLPSPPEAPRPVEVGTEFMTIEWGAPEHGGGDVYK